VGGGGIKRGGEGLSKALSRIRKLSYAPPQGRFGGGRKNLKRKGKPRKGGRLGKKDDRKRKKQAAM